MHPHDNCLRIGNAQGFWGDRPGAAARLLEQQPNLDYITLDYLAEVSLSIMAIQREKNPQEGYAKDFIQVILSLIPFWQNGNNVKIITNAGGLNPEACANLCRSFLDDAGLHHLKIGIVEGDDVLSFLKDCPDNELFKNLNSNAPLSSVHKHLMTANAYLGAAPLVELLKKGAHIIITGRVADPSLTVAPCVAHFNWSLEDYDKIAQATIAGHLIECGCQLTGGISTHWLEHVHSIEEAANLAYPFIEMFNDATFVVTKPKGSGGRVDEQTVKEQLLYEIGDPSAYISPDAVVSFLSLKLTPLEKDRVLISHAKGLPPPATYKVSATYKDGYKAEATLGVFGRNALKKARLCAEIILKRVSDSGYQLERTLIECLGADAIAKGIVAAPQELLECHLRIAAADLRKEALECFVREIAPMVTSGPQGLTGYTSGRPSIREIFSFWPCLIEKKIKYTLLSDWFNMTKKNLVLVERSDTITRITFNRPEKRNALNAELLEQLCIAMHETLKISSQKVLVLAGNGPIFCSGMDLLEASNPEMLNPLANLIAKTLTAIYTSPLITIAAVQGAAIAGGAGIMSACDFAIAATNAKIGYPEIKHGLVAAQVSTLLVRQVRWRTVRELLLLGELISAKRALDIGLISHLAEPEELLRQALKLANQASKSATEVVAETKRLLAILEPHAFRDDLRSAIAIHRKARRLQAANEGISAFLHRRNK